MTASQRSPTADLFVMRESPIFMHLAAHPGVRGGAGLSGYSPRMVHGAATDQPSETSGVDQMGRN
jgi:hypothetical protein